MVRRRRLACGATRSGRLGLRDNITTPALGSDRHIVELRDYWRTIKRRWMTIVACLLLTVAVAGVVTWQTTPQYASTARLFVSTSPSDASQAYQGGLFATQRVASYADLIQSQQLAEQVSEDLGGRADRCRAPGQGRGRGGARDRQPRDHRHRPRPGAGPRHRPGVRRGAERPGRRPRDALRVQRRRRSRPRSSTTPRSPPRRSPRSRSATSPWPRCSACSSASPPPWSATCWTPR